MKNIPVNGALDVSASQELKSIASVDRHSRIQRFDPLPFVGGVVPNLESGHGLAEKEGEAAEVWDHVIEKPWSKENKVDVPVCPGTQFPSFSLSSAVCLAYLI